MERFRWVHSGRLGREGSAKRRKGCSGEGTISTGTVWEPRSVHRNTLPRTASGSIGRRAQRSASSSPEKRSFMRCLSAKAATPTACGRERIGEKEKKVGQGKQKARRSAEIRAVGSTALRPRSAARARWKKKAEAPGSRLPALFLHPRVSQVRARFTAVSPPRSLTLEMNSLAAEARPGRVVVRAPRARRAATAMSWTSVTPASLTPNCSGEGRGERVCGIQGDLHKERAKRPSQ